MPNGDHNASGSFEVKFKSEKSYTVFGKEYARCYANLQTKGSFDKPVPSGPLSYEVSFSADCGCDTVLKNFNYAYQKTFQNKNVTKLDLVGLDFPGKSDEAAQARAQLTLDNPDFSAELLTCSRLAPNARLAAQPSTSLNLTAIDSQMVYAQPAIGADLQQAVANVILFGEAASRASLKSQGYSLTDPTLYQSWLWYGTLQDQLQDLGFEVTSMTSNQVKQQTYSGQINIGEIMKSVISIYLSAESAGEFAELASFLSKDPDDTGVSNFMNFWWNASSYSSGNSGFAVGPIEVVNGMPTVTLVYFQYDVAFTDWRSLFISFHSESFNVYSAAIQLSLDMAVYNQISSDLLSKLGSAVKTHIQNTPVDFG